MKVLYFSWFLLIFLFFTTCTNRKLSIEEILIKNTWQVDAVELTLDIDIEEETVHKMTNYVLNIIKNFDIVFTEEQELQVIWNGDLYQEEKVFWEINPEDSTLLFSGENIKYERKLKVEHISEQAVTLKGKIDETTPLLASEGEGTLVLKAKEENE